MFTALFCLLALLGAERPLDEFSYPDAAAARQAWLSSEHTPPVDVVREGDRPSLQVAGPFATNTALKRAVIDRRVELDLAAPGSFRLEVWADDPQTVAHLTLYFRSGKGWYGASGTLANRPGWQTVRFLKTSFRVEDQPAGWNRIDGIRIAAWKNQPRDAVLRLRRLAAVQHSVAIVTASADGSEAKAMQEVPQRVGRMLEQLGAQCDLVDEGSLAAGALGDRPLAIVAYCPHLGPEAVAALERYVEAGGKLFLCYNLPAKLATALGVKQVGWVKQDRPGQFAEIRFDAPGVQGLPAAVRQASWNITVAEPAGHGARVIGSWHNDQGQPTGQAAMLLGDRGAFLSHILLDDDPEGKRQLLAAVLGRLHPTLWRQVAQVALDRVGQIGHLGELEPVMSFIESTGTPAARERLAAARQALQEARSQLAGEKFSDVVVTARKARELLAEAYLRAQPSRAPEGRAVWNHSGTGAYPGDWDRSAKLLADNGFNMILPNMLWGGLAHYASDLLPRSKTYDELGDQIQQCVAAAKKYGLEVHVWKVNFNLSTAPKDFVEKMRAAGRTTVSASGEPHNWLCPSHPENRKLELESMIEVARKYPVDGLHFDYIRYSGSEFCYCDGCRERFEEQTGRKVADWPKECYSGSRKDEYRDWRCQQITALVAAVRAEAKKLRPALKLSAAVFGSYPSCRESVAQDWPAWVQAGYLDFLCPMDYTESDEKFCGLIENQLGLVAGKIPMYPGIGATASRVSLTADRVAGQIHHARRLGAAGFTIFNFSPATAEAIIPGVGLGAGSKPAVPPHRSRRAN